MREIKFRAWDGKKMVHEERYAPAISFDGKLLGAGDGDFHLTEQWPLMQFTGLKDKNGKEIYEGDIVKHWHPAKVEEIGEVKFATEHYASWYLKPVNSHEVLMGGTESKYEVIGNIYENPELITHPL